MDREVLRISRAITRRLAGEGAEAVILMGSYVRSDAHRESDIDIQAIGPGPYYHLERHDKFLVSISWGTVRQHRQAFRNPAKICGIIPAWRNAFIIHDPRGIAKSLKEEAIIWEWDSLGKKPDRWVAEELTGYAEEVHKLVGNLELERRSAAAVQRSLLAIYMAPILAVHHRVLYDTENQLWDAVSARMGRRWARVQSTALGESGEKFEETCKAALELFTIATKKIRHLLDDRQYVVVAHACRIAGYPLAHR